MGVTLMSEDYKQDWQKIVDQHAIEYENRNQPEEEQEVINYEGFYIEVKSDGTYGKYITGEKENDNFELIRRFDGVIGDGNEIYIERANDGVLEQRIRKQQDLDYIGKRLLEYPDIREQLDMIYHNIDEWRDTIKDIKERNPKGE
tara:strand:+ start:71 stop:505 length:435 start_codon:yes stop_codon:yes gene_type:complete